MTTLVQQRAKNDCFLCCLIMAVGTSYEFAITLWGEEFVAKVSADGLYGRPDIDRAFGEMGMHRDVDFKSFLGQASLEPAVHEFAAAPGHMKALLWGRRALVQVKSKNYEGQSHIVYWDGVELFDPSPLQTYTWDEVQPEHIWLFDERVDGMSAAA